MTYTQIETVLFAAWLACALAIMYSGLKNWKG